MFLSRSDLLLTGTGWWWRFCWDKKDTVMEGRRNDGKVILSSCTEVLGQQYGKVRWRMWV
jgi:hypothetical protein